jgi:hypothetical protein
MFFFGHYFPENESVEKSKGKGRGHRGGKNSDLMLIEVTRKDGVVQHYWKAPEDVKAGDKVVRVKRGEAPAPTPSKGIKKGTKKATVSALTNGAQSIKSIKFQISSAKQRAEIYQKHSNQIVDGSKVLKAADHKAEADYVVDTYKKLLEKDPEMLQKVAARLPEFLDYFGSAKPTHTSSMNSIARMLISGKTLSGSQVRQHIKDVATTEAAGLLKALEKMGARDVAHIRDNIIGTATVGLKKRIDLAAARAAADPTDKAAQTEYESLTGSLRGLEGKFELYRKMKTENYHPAGVKDKHDKMVGLRKDLEKSLFELRNAEGVGLSNSLDARVGVDTKVFVALHHSSRYQMSMDRPGVMVFKRDVLAQEGSTITMQNACEYVAPWKDKKTGKYEKGGVAHELMVRSEELLKGKTVLRDLDDPKTILALAMNAAYQGDLKGYLAKYINKTPDVNPGTASAAEKKRRVEAGETMLKPNNLTEGHLESGNLDNLERIVFKRKEDAEAMKELFPEYASKIDWHNEPDDFISALPVTNKVTVENPFELVEGNYVIRR